MLRFLVIGGILACFLTKRSKKKWNRFATKGGRKNCLKNSIQGVSITKSIGRKQPFQKVLLIQTWENVGRGFFALVSNPVLTAGVTRQGKIKYFNRILTATADSGIGLFEVIPKKSEQGNRKSLISKSSQLIIRSAASKEVRRPSCQGRLVGDIMVSRREALLQKCARVEGSQACNNNLHKRQVRRDSNLSSNK